MNDDIWFCKECGTKLQTYYAIGSEFRKCPNVQPLSNHTSIYIRDIAPKFDPKTGERIK